MDKLDSKVSDADIYSIWQRITKRIDVEAVEAKNSEELIDFIGGKVSELPDQAENLVIYGFADRAARTPKILKQFPKVEKRIEINKKISLGLKQYWAKVRYFKSFKGYSLKRAKRSAKAKKYKSLKP